VLGIVQHNEHESFLLPGSCMTAIRGWASCLKARCPDSEIWPEYIAVSGTNTHSTFDSTALTQEQAYAL